MCTGVEIALVASSVLGAAGAVASGQQQKKMANYQAAQSEADAQAAAKVQADKICKAGAAQVSQANAALAASGVETGEGTALRITSGIVGDAEEDAYTTILNGANSSARLNAQAENNRMRDDVIAGTRRVRIATANLATCQLTKSGDSTTGGVGDGTTVELSQVAGRNILDIRAGIISDQAKLRYLQNYVRSIQQNN